MLNIVKNYLGKSNILNCLTEILHANKNNEKKLNRKTEQNLNKNEE